MAKKALGRLGVLSRMLEIPTAFFRQVNNKTYRYDKEHWMVLTDKEATEEAQARAVHELYTQPIRRLAEHFECCKGDDEARQYIAKAIDAARRSWRANPNAAIRALLGSGVHAAIEALLKRRSRGYLIAEDGKEWRFEGYFLYKVKEDKK